MDTIEDLQPDTELRMVPLTSCRYGRDYPGGAINPRKTDRGADQGLIDSVRENGIVQAPLAKERDGKFYFAAGDRRLDALFRCHAPHINDSGYPVPWDSCDGVLVPIMIRHDFDRRGGNPLALGLQENLHRNNLHPVDRMEGFATLLAGRAEEGIAPMTVEEIAAGFSLRPAQVRQSLRLGVLAPAIRKAWREGALDAPTAEAFTLCRDEKQQVKVLAKLEAKAGPGGRVTPHMVRSALKAQPGEVKRLLNFVGRDVYEFDGNTVDESLFSLIGVLGGEGRSSSAEDEKDVLGEPNVSSFAALKAMAQEALEAEANRLITLPKSEGGPWAWAMAAHDPKLPKGWESWPRMMIDAPKIKDRAAVGCVVSIDGAGALHVEDRIYWSESSDAGRTGSRDTNPAGAPRQDGGDAAEGVDPATKSRDDGGESRAGDFDEGAALSVTDLAETVGDAMAGAIAAGRDATIGDDLPPRLQQQLAEQLTSGLGQMVALRPDLAVPLLLAAIASDGQVVGIRSNNGPAPDQAWDFGDALAKYLAMSPTAQMKALAHVVGAAVNCRIASGEMPPLFTAGPQALFRALTKVVQRPLRRILVEGFDLEAWVKAAGHDLLVGAIGEACGDAVAAKLTGSSAKKLRAFALENLRGKWLPAELWIDDDVHNSGGRNARPKAQSAAAVAKKPARKVAAKKSAKRGRK